VALILASGSPQRREILERLGVSFAVAVSGVPELEDGPPEEVALENAHRKAASVAARPEHAGETVLASDTVVAVGARIFGKPGDPEQAERTLRALSGRRHAVISGLCVIKDGRARTAAARTLVEFQPLSEALVSWYLGCGEWRERAGGYAIQGRGAALVRRIEGDYTNVVGLPVPTLLGLLPGLLGI
jgi:septum formation protein